MKSRVILDASPLVAPIDKSDRFHHWTTESWKTIGIPLFTCEAVISETFFLRRRTYGGQEAVIFLLKTGVIQILFSLSEELEAVGNLMQKYKYVPMSFADACLVRMSESIAGRTVLTLDSDGCGQKPLVRGDLPWGFRNRVSMEMAALALKLIKETGFLVRWLSTTCDHTR